MNNAYQQFLQLKEDVKKENRIKFSGRTLDYYHQLQEAIDREEYERSWGYLQSVMDYIEENEFITERQIKIVDRILNHPDMPIESEYQYGEPF